MVVSIESAEGESGLTRAGLLIGQEGIEVATGIVGQMRHRAGGIDDNVDRSEVLFGHWFFLVDEFPSNITWVRRAVIFRLWEAV